MNPYEINEMLESDFYDDTDNDPDYEADDYIILLYIMLNIY